MDNFYKNKEEWKDIPKYNGRYQISNLGRVRSYVHSKWKMMRTTKNGAGYLIVGLTYHGKTKLFLVHRLVAESFVPNPNNYPIVNHKDENKSNPIYSNLEWCTYIYNHNYIYDTNRKREYPYGRKIYQYTKDMKIIKTWDSIREASRMLNIHPYCISLCCRNKLSTSGGYIWRYSPIQ